MSLRLVRFSVPVLAALFVSVLLSGCESGSVKKVDRQPKQNAPVVKVDSLQIPADWPKEIPTYPGAELLEVSTTPSGKILSFKTRDTADQIFYWYYDTLEAAKWTMKGPTLDVAQNLAIIKSEIGPLSFLFDARLSRNERGEGDGSKITLTTPSPNLGGP